MVENLKNLLVVIYFVIYIIFNLNILIENRDKINVVLSNKVQNVVSEDLNIITVDTFVKNKKVIDIKNLNVKVINSNITKIDIEMVISIKEVYKDVAVVN